MVVVNFYGPTAVTTDLSSIAQKTPARKRSPDVDFQSLWSSVRKKRRVGRSKELGSLADMIEKMIQQVQTAKAKAAKKHINDRIGPWSRRYKYSSPQDYEEDVEEFNSKLAEARVAWVFPKSSHQQSLENSAPHNTWHAALARDRKSSAQISIDAPLKKI